MAKLELEELELDALEHNEERLGCSSISSVSYVPLFRPLLFVFFFGDCNFQWLLFAVWTVYLSHPIECAHAVVICRLHGTRVVILCALLCLTC